MTNNPVDELRSDGAYADVAARLHATLGAPALDPAVRQRHLQAIRDRAAALPIPAPGYAPTPTPVASRWARRLASGVTAAGLVAVMGASGAVAVSHPSLPGDALHPVKEITERVVLAAALPTGLGVDRHLSFADRRLDEAEALVDRDGDPALVAEAIAAHARLLERAGDLADGGRELASRVEAATLVARGRLAHLLDAGLPEVAADQARAAVSAGQERLNPRPATPPATPPAQPAPPTDPAGPGVGEPGAGEPDPPATPPGRTPAPGPATPPGPPSPPAQPGEPANPGPADQPDERRPSSQSSSQPQSATPPQQQPPLHPEGAPSGPADDQDATGHRRLLPEHDRLRLGS